MFIFIKKTTFANATKLATIDSTAVANIKIQLYGFSGCSYKTKTKKAGVS